MPYLKFKKERKKCLSYRDNGHHPRGAQRQLVAYARPRDKSRDREQTSARNSRYQSSKGAPLSVLSTDPRADLRTWIDPRRRRGGVHARFHKSVGARGDRKRTLGRRIERRLDVRRCSTRNAGIYLPNYHGSQLVYRGGSAEFNGS